MPSWPLIGAFVCSRSSRSELSLAVIGSVDAMLPAPSTNASESS